MSAMATQITSLTIIYSMCGLFRCRSRKTSKLRITGLCGGNSPVTGEFPAQRAIYAENVSIWWRHHRLGLEHQGFSSHSAEFTTLRFPIVYGLISKHKICHFYYILTTAGASGEQTIGREILSASHETTKLIEIIGKMTWVTWQMVWRKCVCRNVNWIYFNEQTRVTKGDAMLRNHLYDVILPWAFQ